MANEYAVNAADLTAVADAIRTKGGTSAALSFPDEFAAAIAAIVSGSQVAMGSVTVSKNKNTITISPGFVVKMLCLATERSKGGTYNNGTISTTEGGIASVSSTTTSTVITLAESLSGVTSTKCWWMAAS